MVKNAVGFESKMIAIMYNVNFVFFNVRASKPLVRLWADGHGRVYEARAVRRYTSVPIPLMSQRCH